MIKFFLYADIILLVLGLVLFLIWKATYSEYKKLKNECEELTALNESYKKMQETNVKERIEIEKEMQASVGNGSSDSFNSSIDLLQKLHDKGKSRS